MPHKNCLPIKWTEETTCSGIVSASAVMSVITQQAGRSHTPETSFCLLFKGLEDMRRGMMRVFLGLLLFFCRKTTGEAPKRNPYKVPPNTLINRMRLVCLHHRSLSIARFWGFRDMQIKRTSSEREELVCLKRCPVLIVTNFSQEIISKYVSQVPPRQKCR